MEYQPSQEILDKYAQVLVNFALNSGSGVKKGEVVECLVPDVAKPLALALQNTLLKSGAHPMVRLLPTGFDKDFYTLADKDQLAFFPKKFLKERVALTDHSIGIIADPDPEELKSVEPAKIIMARDAKKEYREWRDAKELQGKFTWTLGLYGVQAKADMVGLSLEEYWQQIIQACFLDQDDPVAEWKKIAVLQQEILEKLNSLEIAYVTVKGEDVDLKIGLGPERKWLGGSGRNIPSFECFTSPDWRLTEGWIAFNQPLYRYGNIIDDIRLEFKSGLVTKASAKRGNTFLQEMLKSPNADKLGEFSLTDRRMSRITHVMAETLFDENIGGPYGNTHVAIGMAYKDAYKGDASTLSKADWKKIGYNDSSEHTDMVSTTDRTVTAYLTDGSPRVIYQGGEFAL
ncbi:MAG TPA: aminopeptidase [Patescibacteria group bacterium]